MQAAVDMAKSGPRAVLPRLRDISPAAFVASVDRVMLALAHSLAGAVRGRLVVDDRSQSERQTALWALALWARSGDPASEAEAVRILPDVLGALEVGGAAPLNTRTMVGLALVAARGRLRLRERRPLELVEVAALTGLSDRRVRQIVAEGEALKRATPRTGYEAPIQYRAAAKFIRERAEA